MTEARRPELGVVIPTLDEEERLPSLLRDLEGLSLPSAVVVADGGSRDRTPEVARRAGARVVSGARGRSAQLNAGARALESPWLLFLHADTRFPPAAGIALERWLATADETTAAHFGFSLEGDDWFWRFIELGQRIRERVYGLAYGDQGLVVSRTLFHEVGGYPDQPLMEDVAILRKLRKAGRVERIPEALVTSPRRYEREGRWRGWLRNAALITLYHAGVPPRILRRWYPGRNGGPDPEESDRTVLVFAKNPEPGRVKTRLAAEIGEEEAARLYRRLGRRVVDQLRGGDYRLVVCYDPPGAGEEIVHWLDGEELDLRPQAEGELGVRLEAAFGDAFRESRRVCVVGTDAPGVDRSLVEEAFRALDTADVVLGPAEDGGYYLMALSQPAPALFREIPWSTSAVLETTEARAREAGLTVARLRTLSDVDTAADLPAAAP